MGGGYDPRGNHPGEYQAYCYLILNPGSRGGKSQALFQQIHRELRERRVPYEYAVTADLDGAETLTREAAAKRFGTVVAVGGDGTINRVINGLYREDGSPAARLGVIYTGTSPDFCLSHGLPVRDVPRAVSALAGGRSKGIGVGRIRYGDGEVRHFACCANIGVGPLLARAANSGIRGKVGDKAGTFLALLNTLARYRRVDLRVNGVFHPRVYNLSVGKTRYVASGLKIANHLAPDDRRMYLLCVRDRILRHVIQLYKGAPLPLDYLDRVTVEGDAQVEFDGDPWGQLPVTITDAPPIEVMYEGT